MSQIPKSVKKIIKPFYNIYKTILYKGLDYYDIWKGNKNPMIPPRSMIFIGDGDYKKTGNDFLEHFKKYGGLKSTDKVLDVGCGIGRMAVPLTEYLANDGKYYGFDIVKKGIKWCLENITTRYPNFHFEHSDIYNKLYNPGGKETSSSYKFNYNDNYFDFVFLTSVFTHMHTQDIDRYLWEISRVMKNGGNCLITFFLINSESMNLIKNGTSTQNLDYKIDEHSFTKDSDLPENAIGFKEEYIRELFNKNGLKVTEPILYGSWCGRRNFISYQDIIVAQK